MLVDSDHYADHYLRLAIEKEAYLHDPGLIGCRRRHRWTKGEQKLPWSWVRGNALLSLVGEKDYVKTPLGTLEFFRKGPFILQFRGGQWNDYWMDDFWDLWALVHTYKRESLNLSPTTILFHENKGDLSIRYLLPPEGGDPAAHVELLITEATSDPPGRLPKNRPRAHRICKYCPVKVQCDTEDRLRGETADWSPSYPQP